MPAPIDPAERRRRKAAFREEVQRLQPLGLTVQHVADAFGKTRALVQYWMQPDGRHQPPDDWRPVLAHLCKQAASERVARAREEAHHLRAIAGELERAQPHPPAPPPPESPSPIRPYTKEEQVGRGRKGKRGKG